MERVCSPHHSQSQLEWNDNIWKEEKEIDKKVLFTSLLLLLHVVILLDRPQSILPFCQKMMIMNAQIKVKHGLQ